MSKLGCLNCIFCEPKYTLTLKCTCDEGTPSCHVGTLFEVSPRHRFYCIMIIVFYFKMKTISMY